MERKKIVVGFLGPKGSFSEEAAIKFQKWLRLETTRKAYSSYDLIDALTRNKIQKAIVPIENSLDGQVNWVIDLLSSKDFPFVIEHELILTIRQNLIGFGEISNIKVIYSHPTALAQCQKLLKSLRVNAKDTNSTSEAIQLIAKSKKTEWAAIGTKRAARIYGVPVIKEGVNDDLNNQTRFIILGGEKKKNNRNRTKTSLIFSVVDRPGALVKVLEIFDVLDINMKTLFSRPLKTGLGQYMFWVDIEGHQNDKTIHVALEALKRKAKSLKILGSYPVSEAHE